MILRFESLLGPLIVVWATFSEAADAPYVFFHERVLGTSMELKVSAPDAAVASQVEAVVLGEIKRLNGVLSQYDRSSEFSRWSRGELAGQSLSHDLRQVLLAADDWRNRSGGALNPAVAAFGKPWLEAERQQRVPAKNELDPLTPLVAQPAWYWDADRTRATRSNNLPLTLDAIAKGYIIDRCCEAALRDVPQATGVVLQIGGDLRVMGHISEWIEVANPRQTAENAPPLAELRLRNRALATSGGYRRGWTIGDRLYSHILDPRSGQPAEHIASATVTAPKAQDADALATILCVLPPEQGLRLVARLPQFECLLVGAKGEIYRSAGWREVLLLAQAEAAPPAAGGLDGFELLLRLEINEPEAARYHRPYVAAWIEDAQGFPLRTLLLWVKTSGSGPTWVPDLKRWYRGDLKRLEVDRRDFVATRSSATRPPGKYEIVWDGLDNLGKPAAPGMYSLRIEAAREHGTYQLIRKELELASTPFKLELPGNIEIKSASVDYRRRAATKPSPQQ